MDLHGLRYNPRPRCKRSPGHSRGGHRRLGNSEKDFLSLVKYPDPTAAFSMKQMTFADAEYAGKRKRPRKELFLIKMDR